jgi:hypothetical protein
MQVTGTSPVINPNAAPGVAQGVLNNMANQSQKKRGLLPGWLHRKPKQAAGQGQNNTANQGQGQNNTANQGQAAPVLSPVIALPVAPRLTFGQKVGNGFHAFFHSLYTWNWTKGLVYWLILSAGTASDLIFLVASLWMSVNANVHVFILQFVTEKQAENITSLATTAYVALPIFIVGLAVVETVNHLKMWNSGGFWPRLWTVIYGIPAVTFLVMDFVTISCSVVNVTFEMPAFFVVLRADSAFIFAFGSLIYFFLGKPQEKERLAAKDNTIAGLRAEMAAALAMLKQEKDDLLATFTQEKTTLLADFNNERTAILSKTGQEKDSLLAKIDVQSDEIESLKSMLTETQRGYTELHKAVNRSEEDALQGYGEVCVSWLKSGIKSADVPTIIHYTGLSTAKINNAFKRGELRKAPNDLDL